MQNDELLKTQYDSRGVVQPRFRKKCTCPAVSGTAEWVLITFLLMQAIVVEKAHGSMCKYEDAIPFISSMESFSSSSLYFALSEFSG